MVIRNQWLFSINQHHVLKAIFSVVYLIMELAFNNANIIVNCDLGRLVCRKAIVFSFDFSCCNLENIVIFTCFDVWHCPANIFSDVVVAEQIKNYYLKHNKKLTEAKHRHFATFRIEIKDQTITSLKYILGKMEM